MNTNNTHYNDYSTKAQGILYSTHNIFNKKKKQNGSFAEVVSSYKYIIYIIESNIKHNAVKSSSYEIKKVKKTQEKPAPFPVSIPNLE